MGPLPRWDLVPNGAVTVVLAYATVALHALPGCVDGNTAVTGRARRVRSGRQQAVHPGQPLARIRLDFP